ncbi:hypothetical protein VNO78_25125 [Psophocarpus tetragonolobus]|uniref:Uncharacterized protein n=1 Tax=Psophocarpus tetragonolobus TaxID=3891 RepID=A0AAN9S749_PSOTE
MFTTLCLNLVILLVPLCWHLESCFEELQRYTLTNVTLEVQQLVAEVAQGSNPSSKAHGGHCLDFRS